MSSSEVEPAIVSKDLIKFDAVPFEISKAVSAATVLSDL
jgi:hypothetical protein